jgi:hypothetical protein
VLLEGGGRSEAKRWLGQERTGGEGAAWLDGAGKQVRLGWAGLALVTGREGSGKKGAEKWSSTITLRWYCT